VFWKGGKVSEQPPARPALDLGGAQLGDAQLGDVAGRDIYNGAAANDLVELLKHQIDKDSQFRMLDLKVREVRQEQVDRQHTELLAELRRTRLLVILGLVIVILVVLVR
jgi:hypothetical protein